MRQKGLIYIPILILLITGVAIGTAFLVNQNPNQDVKGALIAHEGHEGLDDDSDTHEGVKIKTEIKADKLIYFLLNQLTRLFTFHF